MRGIRLSRYASAASTSTSLHPSFDTSSPLRTTTSGESCSRQDELDRGAQKRQRRMGSLAEEESHIPMSFQTLEPTPLHQIWVVAMTTKSFQRPFHMNL